MNRLVLEARARPQSVHTDVSIHYLNREVRVAERNIAHYTKHCQWDLAQAWDEYREQVQLWRYYMLRTVKPVPTLEMCPQCGRVQELERNIGQCSACGWTWNGAPEPPRPAPGDDDV